MGMIGKIVGAVVGLIVFRNFFGMLIGAFVGHMFDLSMTQRQRDNSSFIAPLFAFAGALAKSDGRVSEQEIRAAERLMDWLRLDAERRQLAIAQFNRGKAPEFDAQAAIVELRSWTQGRRDLAFLLLDMLLDLVYAEGTLAANKLNLVRSLCAALGLSEAELAAVAAMKGYGQAHGAPRGGYAGQNPPRSAANAPDPYVVLGIARSADAQEIKRAYRKLMSQHHPDKLGNVPQELKRNAEARAREINAAYERIKTERGFT